MPPGYWPSTLPEAHAPEYADLRSTGARGVQSNRTNDIMRTLTALTAIFLPLNLIAAVFGMNFEFMPWLHQASGFWWTLGGMGLVATSMGLVFWRKRYLARTGD